MAQELTQARLKELLHYDPETGVFTWLLCRVGRAKVGAVAGGPTVNGYVRICVDGKRIRAHKLAWLYVTGENAELLDHINRDRTDNRISNLRRATSSENKQNLSVRVTTKSGVTGVCFDKARQKWKAHIGHNGKLINLGRFDSLEEACAARIEAKYRLHTFNPLQLF